MTQEALKHAFEAHCKDERHHTVAETRYWCRQYKMIAQAAIAALAEHAMKETQRLGQEIEPDDIASILACRDMLDAQPVPPRTWVGLTDEDMADITSLPIGTCSMMLKVEAKLKDKNNV